MERHKCVFRSIVLVPPSKLVTCTDAAFKAQFGEPTGLALRGLVAVLCANREGRVKASGDNGKVNFLDLTVSGQAFSEVNV